MRARSAASSTRRMCGCRCARSSSCRSSTSAGRSGCLIPHLRMSWLAMAVLFLVGFRIALNVVDSNVIDVGYAGVIGANKIAHGQPLYTGKFPKDNANGDTYGPVNYLAYLPFER